jgi:Vam6/Vps39-like protein vacuolar protein sorting-associated protein 39
VKDRLGPSITYLQRLSPEYLDTVFQYSRWIFDENPRVALEVSSIGTCSIRLADVSHKIFTSEEGALPPQQVISFLESLNPRHCARYLEFIIKDRQEESPIYHDRLAKLYLKMTLDAKQAGDEGVDTPNTLDQM